MREMIGQNDQLKQTLFEFDFLAEVLSSNFEYSTKIEKEAASFHKLIYPMIQKQLILKV